ncbi:nuclear transport factor 2 family protein [Oleidesulfovibrio sp.]|uniref:nuclear transport factor 2 family protein n=1 Tax=Oleidesulfovibrio sp. TaxID=2909707 RepID=UPI003A84CDA5
MTVAATPMDRVEHFLSVYTARDVEGVVACYADSESIAAIGTDRVQNYVGREAIRKGMADDFLSFDKAEIDIVWHNAGEDGNTAWVVAACRALFALEQEEVHVAIRLSAVLKRYENDWLLLQTHFSFPS